MNIEFYKKETGEVIDPAPEYELYVVDNEGDVLCISFNNLGDVLGDLLIESSLDWRVIEEVK
tara:strand:- start:1006 stop:1191 length:186 start_codon:yes stop_codon:yes gene_type:complete